MAERLAQKMAKQNGASNGASYGEPRVNPVVEAKIAQFRAANPEFVEHLRSLPRERLENIAILRRMEGIEDSQRIRQHTAAKLEAWLEQRPEQKQRIDAAVAKLAPEEQANARFRMTQSAVQRESLQGIQSAGPRV